MFRSKTYLLFTLLFSLVTCVTAYSQEIAIDKQPNASVFNSLRWFVHSSRQLLEAQIDLTWNYGQQVKLLAEKLADIDVKLEDAQESAGFCKDSRPLDMDNQIRVDILGGQALLGYKAQQLQMELQKLTQGQGNKLETFERAIAKAEDLSEQVMKLRLSIQNKLYHTSIQHPGFLAQGEVAVPIARRLSGPVRGMVLDSSGGQPPNPVILAASAGVTNGKPGPAKASAAESDAKYTTNELKKKIVEIGKQAKNLQQLIYETAQRAENIKRLEKQTEAKLADMKQLTRNWEGKKIPVNEEFLALEKKLGMDIVMYQEALKEIEALRQLLISLFNGTLFRDSETGK